jgi:hypothetical protein
MARFGLKNSSLVLGLALSCLVSSEARTAGTGESQASEPDTVQPQGGKLTLSYKPSKSFKPLFQLLKDQHALAVFVDHINGGLTFPRDLPVIFAECGGKVNAFYKSATGEITFCYELVQYMAQVFLKLKERVKDYDADQATTSAITFVFFHELGHALVDIYDLNIPVKEEDAVDGLATALLLHLDGGGVVAIQGATAFKLMSEESEKDIESLAFWDEHSFGRQRFFNVACWVYGKMGGDELKAALKAKGMQESRLSQCASEFRRLRKSWKALLKPWLIPDQNDLKGSQ